MKKEKLVKKMSDGGKKILKEGKLYEKKVLVRLERFYKKPTEVFKTRNQREGRAMVNFIESC